MVRTALASALAAFAAAAPVAAVDFPPVTDAERALVEVPWEPGAPAVVLFKRATIRLKDYRKNASSYLEVQVRMKVLTAEGLRYGEIALPHSRRLRLDAFEGRTVLPDGRVVPLPDDAVFRSQTSKAARLFVTKAAFPAVAVGAIVDYGYRMYWDSIYFVEPWQFDGHLPTLLSEVTFIVPPNLAMKPWGRHSERNPAHLEQNRTSSGNEIRLWMERLPALADEPFSPPVADRASRFLLLPTRLVGPGGTTLLFETWRSTCDLFDDEYREALRNDRQATQLARQIAAEGADRTAKARALYRFVRDEIRTLPSVWVSPSAKLPEVLEKRLGGSADKALLLKSMLAAVGVDSQLVWAADRDEETIDLEVPNPWLFDRVLLTAELGGERLFLDPSDRALGFGHLAPGYGGTPALIFDRARPEATTLPLQPFDRNARRATIDVAVDAEGRATGTGRLEATGYHAWRYLQWRDGDRPSAEVWKEWLEDAFTGSEIDGVAVDESPDDQRVRVSWSFAERAESALGDEATLTPSRPLGPVAQPFNLPPGQRRTPVHLGFADRDEVEMTVTWPEGWEVESLPPPAAFENSAGSLAASAEVDAAARRLHYRRRLDIVRREFSKVADYQAIRDLHAEAERHDAQRVVLLRR